MNVRKNYDIFDLTKFILSLFIVAIHNSIIPDILSPCARIAVPLFFMISSYLFFERKSKIIDTSRGGGVLYRFVKRNLKLYLFWTIILLPTTALWNIHTYLQSGDHYSPWAIIGHGIQKLLFAAFPASWYIIASVIAILVLYRIPKKYNPVMLLASFGLYLVCCISSNYYYLFDADSTAIQLIEIFGMFFNPPYTSFLVAFIWMGIGKVCAESQIAIKPIAGTFGIILSTILLYAEYFVIKTFSLSKAYDCYIMLVPLCFFIFNALKNADGLKIKNAVSMRKASTFIYCSHMTVSRICGVALNYVLYCQINILVFLLTVITCLIACYLMLKLEGKKHLKWLKYSY